MQHFSQHLPAPRPDDLLPGTIARLGYPGREAVSRSVWAKIREGIDRCADLAQPAYLRRATPFERTTEEMIVGKDIRLETANWTRLAARMGGVRDLCCMAVTLGETLDEQIRRLSKGAMLEALLLDAAASTLCEYCAGRVEAQIAAACRQMGLTVSARFSPGYCDWPLQSGQQHLSEFLDLDAIGLRSSATGLMTPRKSITAVIIAAEQMPARTPCAFCARKCPHRRTS